ncbi:MAG: RlmE family RNA methyltransferase [Wenzhouxiangellaceae bacterium]|nr:RlmE family RNA methyltransferase [Wenzhouxiangellaceae bacterium]
MSSSHWRRRQSDDVYVKRARAQGYRARAAFKLIELDQKHRLLRPGQRVVDLGAAPGSWSQVAIERVGSDGRVIALDLLPIEPIDGVQAIEGDFHAAEVLAELERALGGRRLDLVLSDMAPNVSGIVDSDQARSMALAELALEFARQWLAPGGGFVVKLFQGEGFDAFVAEARGVFDAVRVRKPEASRSESREMYLVGTSRRTG